ncbi:DUF1543 domain-containing protein [Candidatus Uhrbacteria bacterium]|nr:DUF1543 domain-containing protein [Candidatus Uhrbacteria bacterium]
MEKQLNLFLIVLGGKPPGRKIEQHDVAFAIGESIDAVKVSLRQGWEHASHIDSYMAIDEVDGYKVSLMDASLQADTGLKLFFINLGGYRENDLEEYHKKIVVAAANIEEAKTIVKRDSFFLHGYVNDTVSNHIDDKILLMDTAVDDVIIINDMLSSAVHIILTRNHQARFDHNKKIPAYILL